ncbi:hypothetical protein XELAEV_18034651mg [Xenopus laevis]|uniref:Uncharacterized protein n=1 Tax=Xenopus laevis TaxID=8355 RepID=A0A974HBC1_XENLA|nr:hypothetical protein XELAEV_18034651mg [Xenopus laevis]
MICLPKMLYVLANVPTYVPLRWFNDIDKLLQKLLCPTSKQRLARAIMQALWSKGGLALPNFWNYYLAAQLANLQQWWHPNLDNRAMTLEMHIMGSEQELQTLPFTGPRPDNNLSAKTLSTYKCWQIVAKETYLNTNQWSPAMPLWHNKLLGQFLQIPDPGIWANKGITELHHILLGYVLKTFELQNHYLFRYLQLKHAFSTQFPGHTV